MHDDQLHVDGSVVRRLVDEQFPTWRALSVRRLQTAGTENAIYRIGTGFTARFPLRPSMLTTAQETIRREASSMRELAASIPFPTPEPLADGAPGHGYPMPWSVQTWIPGSVATPTADAHSIELTEDLIVLIRAMRDVDTRGRRFSGSGRGGNLRDSDDWMEVCFRESEGLLPVARLRALWAQFRALPSGSADVMGHGDLIPGNLLVEDGRLVGVLDGGSFAPADPALDLVVAWHLLDARRRPLLRRGLGCSDLEWQRGAAWAFQQAMGLAWYYRRSNRPLSELGRSTLLRIIGAAPTGTPR